MHDLEGLFCKTGSLWINRQIRITGKNMNGPKLTGPEVHKGGAGAGLTHGLRPRTMEQWVSWFAGWRWAFCKKRPVGVFFPAVNLDIIQEFTVLQKTPCSSCI